MSSNSKPTSFKQKIKSLFCAKPSNQDETFIIYNKSRMQQFQGMSMRVSKASKSNSPKNRQQKYKVQNQKQRNGSNFQQTFHSKKLPRQTLKINDLILKHSRKNIVEEEFFTNQILNTQVQRHICGRVRGIGIALIKGQFTEQSTAGIKMPIFFGPKMGKTVPYRQQIRVENLLPIRHNSLNLIMYQTTATLSASQKRSPKKTESKPPVASSPSSLDHNAHQFDISTLQPTLTPQFLQLLSILETYSHIPSLLILFSPNLNLSDPELSSHLAPYTSQYLLELESIRKNQTLVAQLLYVSKNASFLKINNIQFIQSVIEELDLTMEQENSMLEILSKLICIPEPYHVRVIEGVKWVKKNSFVSKSLYQRFLIKICQDSGIREIVRGVKGVLGEYGVERDDKEREEKNTPELIQPTPLWGIGLDRKESNQYNQ